MKRPRNLQQDDGRAFDSCYSSNSDKSEETSGKEEGEKAIKRFKSRDKRSPTKIHQILRGRNATSTGSRGADLWQPSEEPEGDGSGFEHKTFINIEDETLSQRMRDTHELQEKLFTWERMQRIAFELTKDIELYRPQQDPRDFNVLWRSYVRNLNQTNEKMPSSVEPYSSDNEKNPLTEVGSCDEEEGDGENVPVVSDSTLKLVPKQEVSPSPEVESLPDYDGEDEEFDLFMQTSIDERIMRLNVFLRSELYFCYYCGLKYKSERDLFEHCPGITEDDHE